MKIVLLGTAYPYRGGLATYNERLMLEFQRQGHEVEIITFSLQYPNLFFPGKTQYATGKAPEDFPIKRLVNAINPFNWLKAGRLLAKQKPDLLILKYWTPFMSPCFGSICRIVKKNKHTKIISIVDNMIPHEKHFYDRLLSDYFVKCVDAFVAMSQSVLNDIKTFDKNKPKALSPHPLFDNFGDAVSREKALQNLGLPADYTYFLFFGFIRGYKGLDWLLEAISDDRLTSFPFKLIVAGEFYEDEKPYWQIIEKHHLQDTVLMYNHFIPNSEVVNYFCAADLIVQPYKDATQSGVTQIGYHFEKPMLVTDVGGLSEIIPDNKVGYVVKPEVEAIADALFDFLSNKKHHAFDEHIKEERKKYAWSVMTATIENLYKTIIKP